MAYVFGYMGVNPAHAGIIKGAWPEGGADGYKRVQPIGPSPGPLPTTTKTCGAQAMRTGRPQCGFGDREAEAYRTEHFQDFSPRDAGERL